MVFHIRDPNLILSDIKLSIKYSIKKSEENNRYSAIT